MIIFRQHNYTAWSKVSEKLADSPVKLKIAKFYRNQLANHLNSLYGHDTGIATPMVMTSELLRLYKLPGMKKLPKIWNRDEVYRVTKKLGKVEKKVTSIPLRLVGLKPEQIY